MAKPRQKNMRLEKTVSLPIDSSRAPKRNPEALKLATVLLTKRLHIYHTNQEQLSSIHESTTQYAIV